MPDPRLIGMLLYPKMTQLDLTGPYEVFARLPSTSVLLLAATPQPVKTDRGLTIVPTHGYDTSPQLDIIFVPGGPGQQDLMNDERALGFLRQQAKKACYVASDCTGSLILGAAGLLHGYRATSHWSVVDLLAKLGATPVSERVVVDRNRITGAGVSAGMDLALTLAAMLDGEEVAHEIQLQIEYDPAPPFDSGSITKAAPSLVERLRQKGAKLRAEREATCQRAASRLLA